MAVTLLIAVSKSSQLAGAKQRVTSLTAELATMQQRNVGLYQHWQAVEAQMQRVAYENSILAMYRHIINVEHEVLALRNQGEATIAAAALFRR